MNEAPPPSFSNANVVELADRLAMRPEIRALIAMLKCGDQIAEALETVMPQLPHYEQRILSTITIFRFLGTTMPASPELFAHLPLTAKITESELMAASQNLVDAEVLEVYMAKFRGMEEMNFAWPALERMIHHALENMNVSPIVGPNGQKIR